MVLCFPEGAWQELLSPQSIVCAEEPLRGWEYRLRQILYWDRSIRDDAVIEPVFNIRWRVTIGGYGVEIPHHRAEQRGSYVWQAPITDLDRDLDRLHFRELSVDREATMRDMTLADDLFGDLLPPRLRGGYWWTLGMTWGAAKLVGLENLMLLMCDNPEGVHRLMRWLCDEHTHFIEWFEAQRLLTLNNEDDYVGSGGFGYTHALPSDNARSGADVTLGDLWGFGESQETVGISPAMFTEFILPYQARLLDRFGLNCYGCCEPLDKRIDAIMREVPRLRRVSVSPWADLRLMAEKLGERYVFSRKPNPAPVCVGFDERAIRQDLEHTVAVAGHLPLEIILKDTHTVENDPTRLGRWVTLARQAIDKAQALA